MAAGSEEEPIAKRMKVEDLSKEDVIIAVMGPSGAGKSSFINTATGSQEAVNDQESCTIKIGIVKFHSTDKSKPNIVLIDTPGFNHNHQTDADVLHIIANWLKEIYECGIQLTGILYVHKIWDSPSGKHIRNIDMFEHLCGKAALQNVVIATTMWDRAGDQWGSELEDKLFEETHWNAVRNLVSATHRYRNTRDSAWQILDTFLPIEHRHPVQLQIEMVDEGHELHQTGAGRSWGIHPLRVEDLSEDDMIIAIMGPSGSGKSLFINTATGSREPIDDLESCTTEIGIVKFYSPDTSKPDVILIDTPGFNHDHMTDAEVLNVIADWLKATYERNIKLTGILYFHKLLDPPSGTHRRNIEMFEKLCGKQALQNVIITTTMWDTVGEAMGLEREENLFEETYRRVIINHGAATARYHNTRKSACDILDRLLQNQSERHVVRLQREMVDMGRQLHETSAGRSWGIQAKSTSRLTFAAMVTVFLKFLNLYKIKKFEPPLPQRVAGLKYSVPQVEDLSPDDVIVALIGLTGSGKSSFIRMATGNDSAVGHSLESCTKNIGMVKVFDIVLVDTPGFDDATRTDREILGMMAKWLTETYKRDIKLAGILYLHRISDNRVGGTPLLNMRMFENLCGKNAFQNVILTTTMWDTVDAETGLQREKELKSEYWKGMINRGSKTMRYRNNHESAWDILDSVLGHSRLAILLQKEMVDMERQLRETTAGQTLYNALERLVKEQQEKLEEIQLETSREGDKKTLQRLRDEQRVLHDKLQTAISEMETLKISVGKRFLRYFSSSYCNFL